MQSGVERLDTRLVRKVPFESFKRLRVGFEGKDALVVPIHPFDEAADAVAVIGARVDIDFGFAELEQAVGMIEAAIIWPFFQHRDEDDGVCREAKLQYRIEHPA